jgi:uncharacterized membrane protein
MANQQASAIQLSELIVTIVKTKQPDTTASLIQLVQQKYPSSEADILSVLLQLEREGTIRFNKKLPASPNTFSSYVFSSNALSFWSIIVLSILLVATVFAVPVDAYPLAYLRPILGTLFVLFLPGFVFVKTLYPCKVPIPTSSMRLDTIEIIALSIVLSITLVAITGLILNYTPWGIQLTPITLSLFALSVVFGFTALIRKYQAETTLNLPA